MKVLDDVSDDLRPRHLQLFYSKNSRKITIKIESFHMVFILMIGYAIAVRSGEIPNPLVIRLGHFNIPSLPKM